MISGHIGHKNSSHVFLLPKVSFSPSHFKSPIASYPLTGANTSPPSAPPSRSSIATISYLFAAKSSTVQEFSYHLRFTLSLSGCIGDCINYSVLDLHYRRQL